MKVNYETFKKFRSFLIHKTQVVGTFYNKKYFPQIIIPLSMQKVDIKERLSNIVTQDRKEDVVIIDFAKEKTELL